MPDARLERTRAAYVGSRCDHVTETGSANGISIRYIRAFDWEEERQRIIPLELRRALAAALRPTSDERKDDADEESLWAV